MFLFTGCGAQANIMQPVCFGISKHGYEMQIHVFSSKNRCKKKMRNLFSRLR